MLYATWWIFAILGILSPTDGLTAKPPDTQPSSAQISPLSIPQESSLPKVTNTQQLDEDLRLVTGNNEADVRLIGAKRLLMAGSAEAAQRLVGVLKATPPDLAAQIAVCQAVREVEAVPSALVSPLLSLLGDTRTGLSDAVVRALRRFEDGSVVDQLRDLARSRITPIERREAAVRALGEMGERKTAVAALIELAQSESGAIRQAALWALEQATGVTLSDANAAWDWWETHKNTDSFDWLKIIHENSATQNRVLRDRTKTLTRRLVAACRDAYVRTESAGRPKKLLTFLSDDLPEVRVLGLELVNALITDRKEVSREIKARLVEMVADPDAVLRQKVAAMVGDLRMTEAVPKLVEVLAVEPDYRARAAEVGAVGRLDGLAALTVVQAKLEDDAPAVVAEAAAALAEMGRRLEKNDSALAAGIVKVMIERYSTISPDEIELREKFLESMARLGTEAFRPLLRGELAGERPLRVRRAAILGLGGYADTAAADDVRSFVNASESELRLVAVQALGLCGRTTEDLELLAARLDVVGEPDTMIRERAWESYVLVALRRPPKDWLGIADGFDRPNDQTAQGRRLQLLKAITGTASKLKQLSLAEQIAAFERIGNAQAALGDFTAAAAGYDQALGLLQSRADAKFGDLAGRVVSALLRSRQDRVAAERFVALAGLGKSGESPVVSPLVTEAVLREVRMRSEAAGEATAYVDVLRLIDVFLEQGVVLPDTMKSTLEISRQTLTSRRATAVEHLLDSLGTDTQAEAKLLAYGKELVLPSLQEKLLAQPSTTSPSSGPALETTEERLIRLGRQLVEAWPGYPPGCSPQQRAKAVEALMELSRSAPKASAN